MLTKEQQIDCFESFKKNEGQNLREKSEKRKKKDKKYF